MRPSSLELGLNVIRGGGRENVVTDFAYYSRSRVCGALLIYSVCGPVSSPRCYYDISKSHVLCQEESRILPQIIAQVLEGSLTCAAAQLTICQKKTEGEKDLDGAFTCW